MTTGVFVASMPKWGESRPRPGRGRRRRQRQQFLADIRGSIRISGSMPNG
ncbi:hypothetical protein AB5I41_11330 [Sphingomonas sp. MMS24-JH45]